MWIALRRERTGQVHVDQGAQPWTRLRPFHTRHRKLSTELEPRRLGLSGRRFQKDKEQGAGP